MQDAGKQMRKPQNTKNAINLASFLTYHISYVINFNNLSFGLPEKERKQ